MSAIPDSTLAASEQLIADLQRQLAEFRAERDEALQRETATAEVLQLINSSPADLAQVFDAILEKAHSLCGAEHGQLYLYDGELLHPGAVRGEVADVLRQPWKPGPDNLSWRLIAGDAFVQVADTGRLNDPISQAASQLTGMRTVLLVPLRKDGVYLGHIVSARKEVRPFSDKQIALLQNFAHQAVIAMENARLLGELQARTRDLEESLEYQTATSDVLKVILSLIHI